MSGIMVSTVLLCALSRTPQSIASFFPFCGEPADRSSPRLRCSDHPWSNRLSKRPMLKAPRRL